MKSLPQISLLRQIIFHQERDLCAFQHPVTDYQIQEPERKKQFEQNRPIPGYSWLWANDPVHCTALYFHTIFYYGTEGEEYIIHMISESRVVFRELLF